MNHLGYFCCADILTSVSLSVTVVTKGYLPIFMYAVVKFY